VAAGPGHPELPPQLRRLSGRLRAALFPRAATAAAATAAAASSAPATGAPATARQPAAWTRGGADLEIRRLSVSYGGVQAVDDVSLQARRGSITGLIGPNGAGKTTTFNVCSGLVKPTSGQVIIDGHNVTGLATARRARLGLGRTFQQTELFPSMTVLENLTLGCEASIAGASPWSQITVRRAERATCSSAVAAAIELCHLQGLLRVPAAALSTGQRRMVEIARCIAGPVKVLLLDEPSAGLDPAETARLGDFLQHLVQERGLGVLAI